MSYADYRPWLPSAEDSKIAGADSVSHTKARLELPRAQELFRQWGTLWDQPYVGVTTNGKKLDGLYELKPSDAPSEAMATAAWKLLAALSDQERTLAHHPVDSHLWRKWQNTEMWVEKYGLRLEHASPDVRDLVLAVVKASLSDTGFEDTVTVMQLNAFLGEVLNAESVMNEWTYNFCIFGDPHVIEPWGWQLWGHHLSVSCLVVGGRMVLTPFFLGAEICYADQGRFAGRSLFKDHEFKGLQLMKALPEEFQAQALVGRDLGGSDLPEGRVHFADYCMLGGAYRDNRIVPYEGVVASRFKAPHRNALLDLVDTYIGAMPDGPRQAKMAEFERHLDDTHFCWIGGYGPDDPFYYRIQSPVTFIEFDHHPGLFLTNDKPLKYHVHTVVRSPNGNDYGIDTLRQHHLASRHGHGHHEDHD